MFNERARFRIHHPVGSIPTLMCAPDGTPDEALAHRVIAAFHKTRCTGDAGAVWGPLLREKQDRLERWLGDGDAAALAGDVAALGRSEAAQGFFGGAGQHRKCAADPSFAQLLAAWTCDKLLSLAEALGVVRLELPETGCWGDILKVPAAELWTRIEHRLGVDLSPPDHVGGFLGIGIGERVIQMRIIEAIYAAYRLRELADERGYARVCEIGAGVGLTAYYAVLLGIRSYTIIDLPTVNAIQGYALAGSRIGDRVALLGEKMDARAIQILPPEAFANLPAGSIDILFNQDSLPEIEPRSARDYLRDAVRLGIPMLLSINQEAHLPTSEGNQRSVPELVAQTGRYRARSRHRHWLRQGYLEERFELV